MFPLRDSERSESTPYVTIGLIALNVLVWLYQVSLDPYSLHDFLLQHGTVPRNFSIADLFSSMFMHGSWMHMLGNVWFLWVFGDNVEDVLGHWQYLAFYLLSGLGGGLLHVAFNLGSAVPAIGASGAISGVMGAYVVKFPKARIHTLVTLVFFFTTMEVPALLMIGFWFAVQVFSGLGSLGAASAAGGGTAWFAHLGGFVAGAVLIKVMPTRAKWAIRQEYNW